MSFNPLYATGPGRPVNLRVDPSIQPRPGEQIAAIGQFLANTPMGAGGGPLPASRLGQITADGMGVQDGSPKPGGSYQPTTMDRIGGAVASFGAGLDPNSVYGPEAFLGGAARGFAGVQTYLNNLRQQHAEGQRKDREEELNRRNIESQIADRSRLQAQGTTPEYITDPTDANFEIQIDRDRQGNRVYAKDPEGRPIRRSKREVREAQETWQREGYSSFEAWRADKLAGGERPDASERRAAGLLTGAEVALGDAERLLAEGFSPRAEPGLSQALGMLFDSSKWRNATATPQGKQYYNAVERLFTNYLYTVSGAQVPPAEIVAQARQSAVDFFDDPSTRDQKMRYLRGKVDEMRVLAGRAIAPAAADNPYRRSE